MRGEASFIEKDSSLDVPAGALQPPRRRQRKLIPARKEAATALAEAITTWAAPMLMQADQNGRASSGRDKGHDYRRTCSALYT